MGNDFFRFKQFTVRQGGAAMKVGVDSVLLGAWACVDHAVHILDVGAGTGLLALMMAQRFPGALIDAVEIDKDAHRQAIDNVTNSPWSMRIRVICDDFIHYAEQCPLRYNLIISNPPYFTASLKPADAKRNVARHNDSLPHDCLLAGSAKLLTPAGILAIVLPPAEALKFIEVAAVYGLSVKRTMHVQTLPSKPVYRILVELSKTPPLACGEGQGERLCIEMADRSGETDEYKQLTKEFYLNK
jgi:tRNA1Val (adenine37-N6)-methyltransferase